MKLLQARKLKYERNEEKSGDADSYTLCFAAFFLGSHCCKSRSSRCERNRQVTYATVCVSCTGNNTHKLLPVIVKTGLGNDIAHGCLNIVIRQCSAKLLKLKHRCRKSY